MTDISTEESKLEEKMKVNSSQFLFYIAKGFANDVECLSDRMIAFLLLYPLASRSQVMKACRFDCGGHVPYSTQAAVYDTLAEQGLL
jgi:hypothetical protein